MACAQRAAAAIILDAVSNISDGASEIKEAIEKKVQE
jgi:hypothetical protein